MCKTYSKKIVLVFWGVRQEDEEVGEDYFPR